MVIKSEFANDNNDFNYYDDAIVPSASSAASSLTSGSLTSSIVIKQEPSSSSSSSSSWQYIDPNHDMPNTKALLFGDADSRSQFTFPSIDIFPAVISGPWNDPNYYGSDDEDEEDEVTNSNSKKKRKRQRSPNPDYDLITAATETNLRLLNINPDSKEGKAQRRRIRNKISAQMHRERKKAYIVYLENIVRHRESTIVNMRDSMELLMRENNTLKLSVGKNISGTTKENITTKRNDQNIDYTTEYITSSDDDEDTTSIISKGTSSSSSSSVSSPQSEANAKFGSKFSLFSILFMFGFTFFGPLNPSSSTGTGVSLFQTPSLLGHRNIVNRDSLLQLAPPSLPSESDLKVSGRVLLSLPTEEVSDTITNTANALPKLKITPMSITPLSIPTVTRSKALWKYQDRVLHLFPKLALPDPMSHGVGKKRHLRSRDTHPTSTSDYGTALVPLYNFDYDETSTKSKTQPSSSPSSISRVLLTEGKALLDPTLASGRVVQHEDKSQKEGSSLSLALSTWTNPSSNTNTNTNSNPIYSVSVRPQDSNVLVMLLPANQIRWGKSWEEGKDTISSGLDFDFSTDDINGYSKDDIDSAWVEIGCSVFKAQLVKNITMI